MRRVLCAVIAFVCFGSLAKAADIEFLRGSRNFIPERPAYPHWDGYYIGGQLGFASTGANFQGDTKSVIGNLLTNTLLESEQKVSDLEVIGKPGSSQDATFGIFFGYNAQWEDAVIGVELNYNHTSAGIAAEGSIDRSFNLTDGFIYDVHAEAAASVSIHDYLTLRARGGYAMDSFMPYITAGIALGLASNNTTASVSYPTPQPQNPTPPIPPAPSPFSASGSQGRKNELVYGFALGAGAEWAITERVFLRGEYEFIQFTQSKAAINNIRAGLGVSF